VTHVPPPPGEGAPPEATCWWHVYLPFGFTRPRKYAVFRPCFTPGRWFGRRLTKEKWEKADKVQGGTGVCGLLHTAARSLDNRRRWKGILRYSKTSFEVRDPELRLQIDTTIVQYLVPGVSYSGRDEGYARIQQYVVPLGLGWEKRLHIAQITIIITISRDPYLPLSGVVQRLYYYSCSPYPTQETCTRSCRKYGSDPATWEHELLLYIIQTGT